VGPYDVKAGDGTLIEVKATGRLQSWAMKEPSTPSWSFKSVKAESVWSETEGAFVPVNPRTRVHVWVFALHTPTRPELYDPLDIGQWEFRVVAHRELLATGQLSARIALFERLGIPAVPYEGFLKPSRRLVGEMTPSTSLDGALSFETLDPVVKKRLVSGTEQKEPT
jgi:hypothetical protein